MTTAPDWGWSEYAVPIESWGVGTVTFGPSRVYTTASNTVYYNWPVTVSENVPVTVEGDERRYGYTYGTSTAAPANWVSYAYASSAGPPYGRVYDHDEMQRRVAEAEAASRQRNVARVQAEERAEALLASLLTPEQLATYRRERIFKVTGSLGGRYRIYPGSVGNVEWLHPDGRSGGRICAHPEVFSREGALPTPDVAIGQLLALSTDEAAFVRRANVHVGPPPPLLVRS